MKNLSLYHFSSCGLAATVLFSVSPARAQTFNNFQLNLGGTTPIVIFAPTGWSAASGSTDREDFDGNLTTVATYDWTRLPSTLGWSSTSTALLISGLPGGQPYESISTTITGLTPGSEYLWSFEAAADTNTDGSTPGAAATSATLSVTFDGVSGGAYNLNPQTSTAQRYDFTFTADGDGQSVVRLFAGNGNVGGGDGNPYFMVLGGSGQFSAVPEPSGLLFLGGTVVLGLLRRRRK
ncbi:MAG: PEP-CTERM sorting domain-containing protein [Verrucomicrobiota bacterium]